MLDLSANPVVEIEKYRENVYEKLYNLQELDGYTKEGDEVSSEEEDPEMFDSVRKEEKMQE